MSFGGLILGLIECSKEVDYAVKEDRVSSSTDGRSFDVGASPARLARRLRKSIYRSRDLAFFVLRSTCVTAATTGDERSTHDCFIDWPGKTPRIVMRVEDGLSCDSRS